MRRPLICLTHLRWDFVYQRPNHLMARAARSFDVYVVEEPVLGAVAPSLELRPVDGLTVVRPHLPSGLTPARGEAALGDLYDELVATRRLVDPIRWYYTPMALPWTESRPASVVVYDCMDELSAFQGAPPELVALERRLIATADLVLTGGRQLFEAKRYLHPNVHLFPSSVDRDHFARARRAQPDPVDQASIARPRIGFFGVIDERLDLELIDGLAARRPDWQVVLVGPVAKIDPARLPKRPNVHHLGPKSYEDLPAYLAGWDVAIMPFARNEATRFISPTKTPEYLAGGKPVVATSIRDVVEPYGRERLARIADTPADTETAISAALAEDPGPRIATADAFLARMSWKQTWAGMEALVAEALEGRGRQAGARVRSRSTQPTTQAPISAALDGELAAVRAVRQPAPVVRARVTGAAAARGRSAR